jgi:hypothetical protein
MQLTEAATLDRKSGEADLSRRAVEGSAVRPSAPSAHHPSSDRAWSRARPNVLTMSPVG